MDECLGLNPAMVVERPSSHTNEESATYANSEMLSSLPQTYRIMRDEPLIMIKWVAQITLSIERIIGPIQQSANVRRIKTH